MKKFVNYSSILAIRASIGKAMNAVTRAQLSRLDVDNDFLEDVWKSLDNALHLTYLDTNIDYNH